MTVRRPAVIASLSLPVLLLFAHGGASTGELVSLPQVAATDRIECGPGTVPSPVRGCVAADNRDAESPRRADRDSMGSGSPASRTGIPPRPVPCYTGGPAIQVLLAPNARRNSDTAAMIAKIQRSIEVANNIYYRGSGGTRELRVVTEGSGGDCRPKVTPIGLNPALQSVFSGIQSAVAALGYTARDRKYVIYGDSNHLPFCGIADAAGEALKSPLNYANRGPSYAYNQCWEGEVAAHEITHFLGAVNSDAPNATSTGHCTDQFELMCYDDSAAGSPREVCPMQGGGVDLDCNDDDYFSVDPVPGSFLTTHWNVADSSFLHGGGPAPLDVTSRPAAVTGARAVAVGAGYATITWDALPNVDHYSVWVPGKGYQVTTETSMTVTGLAASTEYRFGVQGVNSLGTGIGQASVYVTTLASPTPVELVPPLVVQPQDPSARAVLDRSGGYTWRMDSSRPADGWQYAVERTTAAGRKGLAHTQYTLGPSFSATVADGDTICVRGRAWSEHLGQATLSPWTPRQCVTGFVDDRRLDVLSGRTGRGRVGGANDGTTTALLKKGSALGGPVVAGRGYDGVEVVVRTKRGGGNLLVRIGRVTVGRIGTGSATSRWRTVRVDLDGRRGRVKLESADSRPVVVDGLGLLLAK